MPYTSTKQFKNAALFLLGISLAQDAAAAGYLDLSLGVNSQSLQSENSSATSTNTSMSPDIDLTVGFSLSVFFIGVKYFSYQESKEQKLFVQNEIASLDKNLATTGTTKGLGYTVGLTRPGLSILYTKIDGASKNATYTSEKIYENTSTPSSFEKSDVELSDADGYMVDFFYGYQVSSNIYFGPKLSYTELNFKNYKIDQEEVLDFINLGVAKFTPKIGIVASL